MRSLLRRILGRSRENLNPPLLSESGRLRLRPLLSQDHQAVAGWFADSESCRLAFGVDTDSETLAEMSREYLDDLRCDGRGVLLIEEATANLPLGFLRYKLFRKDRRSLARVGIMVGASQQRGRGLGSEAMRILVRYLFETRGVDTIELDTASFNLGAQGCFQKCGFEIIREMEIIGLHNRWTEKRVIMRLSAEQWRATTTVPPSPEAPSWGSPQN